MNPDAYAWCGMPDPESRRYKLKIIRAPKTGWIDVGILSEQAEGVDLHWLEGVQRNVGCTGEGCEGCENGFERKWRGYIACLEKGVPYVRLLEVTMQQLSHFNLLYPLLEIAGLRGLTVRAFRSGIRKVPTLELRPVPRAYLPTLRPAPDVRVELHRIWTSPPRKRPS